MYTWEIADAVKNEYLTIDDIRAIMDCSSQVYRWSYDGDDETYSYHTLYTYHDGNVSFKILNYNKRGDCVEE